MKTFFMKQRNVLVISIVMILAILIFAASMIFTPNVQASTSDELIVNDYSTESVVVHQYSNIQGFLNRNRVSTYSVNADENDEANIDVLYDALSISEEDVKNFLPEELLTATSITVCDTLLAVDEEGNLTAFALPREYSKDFDDIPNNKGNKGYMSGRIVSVQNPDYNKVEKSNGKITKFYAYGFELSFSMKWLKTPTYRKQDMFTFFTTHDSFTEEDSNCTFSATKWMNDMQNPQFNTSKEVTMATSKYYEDGWPVFLIDLPANGANTTQSVSYSNFGLSARARVYANGYYFNARMMYGHKQGLLGDWNVSFSPDGPSISISGAADYRIYDTPNFFIPVFKDSAMEKLR